MKKLVFLIILITFCVSCQLKSQVSEIKPGAYQLHEYLPLLRDKKVGVLVNHTAMIRATHPVDTLMKMGIDITKIFSPEHGFRGTAADGELILNQETEYPVALISLYGSNKKPTDQHLEDLDVIVFDIQDVGVRFYTYASTMTWMMDACARNGVPMLILDRPNPHASYLDGPVLDTAYSSIIGLHPLPVVHGLTLGELAGMINGERWLESGESCDLTVIKIRNWDHSMRYSLPVRPSPNLPNDLAISLYPSLGFFEGTVVSVGRGTEFPFQVIGHPEYAPGNFSFVPTSNEGSKYPPLEGETCYGHRFKEDSLEYKFTLSYLIHYYSSLKDKLDGPFFKDYFTLLAGNETLRRQVESGWSEQEIRQSWQEDLETYRQLRSRYLLYKD